MSETANAGAIKATIDFDAGGLERAVNKAMSKATSSIEDQINRSMQDVQDSMESGFRRWGGGILAFLGLEDIAGGLRQLGGFVLRLGQETEAGLNMFRAVSGATADEMERVGALANQLGNDISLPGTSAADAAKAMTELAKAGFTVDEAMAAAKGTLQLATAAQIDAGTAAEISSKQLQAFGLEVEDAGMVADILANAANETSADMQGMADSLNQTGAVASASGISFTETAAAVALMADNAIIGSDAGTSLKAMLLALQAPTGQAAKLMSDLGIEAYDNQGRMKSLAAITGELTEGTRGLTDQQKQAALATIFGADAIRTVNVLMAQGEGELRDMTTALEQEGSAAKLAAANSKGLVGALGALQSTAESVAIEVYQNLAPAIDSWLRGRMEELPGILEATADYLGQLGEELAPAANLIGMFISAAEPGAVLAFKAALAAVLGVLEAVNVILGPLASAIEANEGAFKGIVSAVVAATIAYKVMNAVVGKAMAAYTSPQWAAAEARVKSLGTTVRSTTALTNGFRAGAKGLMGALGGPWGLALAAGSTALGFFAASSAEAKAEQEALAATLDQTTGSITAETESVVAATLAKRDAYAQAKLLGISEGELLNAALGVGDELDRVNGVLDDHIFALNTSGSAARRHTAEEVEASIAAQLLQETLNLQTGTIAENRAAIQAATKAKQESMVAEIGAKQSAVEAADAIRGSSEQVIQSEKRLMSQTHDTSAALDRQSRSAERVTRAIKGLNDEVIEGIESEIAFEEAADNLRGVIRKLTPEAVKTGKALDITSATGREVYRAFLDVANSSASVEGGMAAARKQIFDTIRPMVDSKAEARRLTNQFFELEAAAKDVPEKVAVDVEADVSDAMRKFGQVRYEMQQLDGDRVKTYVETVYTSSGRRFKDVPAGVPGNAHGGPIYGEGTGTSDDNLRRLSDGEHVLTAREVDMAGGHAGVYALRNAIKSGALASLAANPTGGGALVEQLSVSVGDKGDLPDALDETLFHLRRIRRGSRY